MNNVEKCYPQACKIVISALSVLFQVPGAMIKNQAKMYPNWYLKLVQKARKDRPFPLFSW